GGLWAPVIQIVMGAERVLAVHKPVWFHRTHRTRSAVSIIFSMFFIIASISLAFVLAWTRRQSKVPYYCGRKVAFTATYGMYVYCVNVGGGVRSYRNRAVLNTVSQK
ncbi:hypothetical protein PENTCL1PPCAC_25400, partial [Pristionchus entomophagus]